MFISANDSFEAFDLVIGQLKKDYETALKKADETLPQPMSLGSYPSLHNYAIKTYNNSISLEYPSYWFTSSTVYSSDRKPIETLALLDSRKAELFALIDRLEVDTNKVIEENASAITNNISIHGKVTLMMKHIGISVTYDTYEFKTNRSRTRTRQTHIAGFSNDLDRVIPRYIKGVKPDCVKLREKVEELYKKSYDAIRKIEADKAIETKKAQDVHKLALLRAKYTPTDAFADAHDILNQLLEKNKYLRLSHFLEKNRGDWSDGCDYAVCGLDNFTVANAIDKKIDEEIQGLIDDWYNNPDGRIFRDCEYNYGALYAMVDDDVLKADYNTIRTIIADF